MFEKAMKCFREASKKDESAGNIKALEGMILCQLLEGSVEDAEAQIELLTLMHGTEDLGFEFAYIQALLLRGKKLQHQQNTATASLNKNSDRENTAESAASASSITNDLKEQYSKVNINHHQPSIYTLSALHRLSLQTETELKVYHIIAIRVPSCPRIHTLMTIHSYRPWMSVRAYF